MAKGFMIFLEGGEPPKKVHKKIEGAYREIYRLSEKYPGCIVTLYHVVKRVKDGKSIGSHLPESSAGMVNVDELVTHDQVPGWKPRSKRKTATT